MEAFPSFNNKQAFLPDVGISRHPFCPTTNTLMAGTSFYDWQVHKSPVLPCGSIHPSTKFRILHAPG